MTQTYKITIANVFFLVIVILHLIGKVSSEELAFFSKPFLMISLALVYLASVKKPNFWFVSALFFSFWGDVFLLFPDTFFVFGLGSFLVAHLLYIKLITTELKIVAYKKVILAIVPFLIYLTLFFYLILAKVINIKLPVIVYGIVICTFGVLALLLFLQQKNSSNLWLFLGALFFIVSDSLIAINKFYYSSEIYQIFIMITYIIAQFLICKSFIAKAYHQ